MPHYKWSPIINHIAHETNGVQCLIHKGSQITPILSRINQTSHIEIYIFKIHLNIVLPWYLQAEGKQIQVLRTVELLQTMKIEFCGKA